MYTYPCDNNLRHSALALSEMCGLDTWFINEAAFVAHKWPERALCLHTKYRPQDTHQPGQGHILQVESIMLFHTLHAHMFLVLMYYAITFMQGYKHVRHKG